MAKAIGDFTPFELNQGLAFGSQPVREKREPAVDVEAMENASAQVMGSVIEGMVPEHNYPQHQTGQELSDNESGEVINRVGELLTPPRVRDWRARIRDEQVLREEVRAESAQPEYAMNSEAVTPEQVAEYDALASSEWDFNDDDQPSSYQESVDAPETEDDGGTY